MAQPPTQSAKPTVNAQGAKPAGAVGSISTGGGQQVAAAGAPGPAVVKAPPFKIESLHESKHWLKLFIYGGYGVGKTALAGSAALVPQMRDVLMIDAEAGGLTIATNDSIKEQEAQRSIDRVRVSSFKEFARVQEFLKLHCKFRDEDNEEKLKELESKLRGDYVSDAPARRYNTVIIDSLSEVEAFSMYQLLGISDRTQLDEEVQGAEWAQYKQNHSQILRSVRAYRDLPMHVIITSASNFMQDDRKRMIYSPALTGKLAKQVQGFMDMVGFYTMVQEGGEDVRKLFVQPGAQYDAKNRFATYKEKSFNDPTIESILRAVGLLQKGKA